MQRSTSTHTWSVELEDEDEEEADGKEEPPPPPLPLVGEVKSEQRWMRSGGTGDCGVSESSVALTPQPLYSLSTSTYAARTAGGDRDGLWWKGTACGG